MPKRSGLPGEDRIAALYAKISDRGFEHRQSSIETRNFAQKVAYFEEACKSILTAIKDIDSSTDHETIKDAVSRLKSEFRFLTGINN
jgi:hypothetical protein